jgi:hypothetical protein
MKYYFRVIGVRTGEYEFELKRVEALPSNVDPKQHFTNIAKNFYDGGEQWFENKEEFYFFGGEICAWVEDYKEISKEEFEVLNKYL